MIPVYKPFLPKKSLQHAEDALKSGWISSGGKYLNIVEQKLQELLQVKHVLLVNNGTSATHLVAKALHYQYPKIKNVIIPNNVFIAAINAFLYDQKFHLHAHDAKENTWNLDLKNIKDPEAILLVHNLGNIIDVAKLKEVYPQCIFVEDNCEGFLGKYNNCKNYTGTLSLASSISFYGNKNITCGEGGAFITNDKNIFDYIKCIHGQGQSEVKFLHQELGYNYRLSNVQAAILLGQLEQLSLILEKKHTIFCKYQDFFARIDRAKIQIQDSNTFSSNWMFAVRVIGGNYTIAKSIFEKNKIEIRPMFYPIDKHAHLINNPYITYHYDKSNNMAQLLNKECVVLPSYPSLKKKEMQHIFNTFNEYYKLIKR